MRTRVVLTVLMAMGLGACATSPGYYDQGRRDDGYSTACANCGTIEKIDRVYGERKTSGGGAVLGAIIGGALGNQVGKGDGRKAATIAGAVVGGVVGNNVEKDQRSAPRFEIFVLMDDGRRLVIEQPTLDDLRDGDRVQIYNGRARLL
jgi:outer membrane lipoprotein SlyB